MQRELSGHGRAYCKIFGVGATSGETNQDRAHSNLSSEACVVPDLKCLPKIHKSILPNVDPKTRPVVGARSCMTSRPGEALCDIMGAVVKETSEEEESLSTEDTLYCLK